MGIKNIFNRFKEQLQPIPESVRGISQKRNNEVKKNNESVRTLDEYIEFFANMLYELNLRGSDWDYRSVVNVYDQLIDKCLADKKSLVERLTKAFVLKTHRIYDDTWAVFLAALYIVCNKYQLSYSWFIGNVRKFCLDFSFSSFELVCEAAKVYNLDVNVAKKEIENIWAQHFNAFCRDAKGDPFAVLKRADKEFGHNWGEYLYEKLSTFDSWVEVSKWEYNYDYAKAISQSYPELTSLAYRHLILYFLYEFEEYYEDVETDEKSNTLINYLQHISVLADNNSVEFEFKDYWCQIVKKTFALLNGNALTAVVEVLNKIGHISLDDIHKYIIDQTLYFLSGNSNMTCNGAKLVNESNYCVEEISFIERLKTLHRLLSNKVVFEVVSEENYAIIQTFNYGA